jgi:hypothetical protein
MENNQKMERLPGPASAECDDPNATITAAFGALICLGIVAESGIVLKAVGLRS